ncbi:zinc finger CCCH domain-containing protein 64 [Humulus lupulus]|uniref:zinc finger CCCH domain-containing protein 64 n=1 Tax=Humulus lupulus TaxID=3486 RepID=UPI002B40C35C|nr:zinc finger CCCH domain-containing protein 64 [Humulus lupulus]XP_062091035.1 zinc finger CCCH domain-containing protein 64 [Humulus lupulus]
MAPPRILLCGDVLGRLNQLFKRFAAVNKSAGPFDALLCVGQFFPDSPERLDEFTEYVEGRSEIPIPTYFIGDYGVGAPKVLLAASKESGNQGFKMDGLKVCEKLYWLKGSGKFTLHGLCVAYLSGRHSSSGQQFGTYSQDDVDALRAIAEDPGIVDIFLTNEWPSGVTNSASASDVPPGISESSGSDSTVAELVSEIKPRYHIAGVEGVFYAREPYSNVDAVHVTRFIGLAAVGNKDKQKFIHAISPTPASMMSAAEISMKSTNTTSSPYSIPQMVDGNESTKRSSDSVTDSQYWRYDVSTKRQKQGAGNGDKLCFKFVSSGTCPREENCHFQHDMAAREQFMRGVCFDFINKGKCERGPDCNFKHSLQEESEGDSHRRRGSDNASTNRSKECWFCMSSPNVESHLIISIGENFYCALAKGPLVKDHVLVIPVEHLPNTIALSQQCESELDIFQSSLKKFYKNQGKEAVFFEWVSKRSTHANLQVIPVPSSKAAAVQNIFNFAADKMGFKFAVMKFNNNSDGRNYLRTQFDRNLSFFYAELPDGTILSHVVEENEKFPAQFGREVLAGLLGMAKRADWRNCTCSKEEETEMAGDFKTQFQEFDPNE